MKYKIKIIAISIILLAILNTINIYYDYIGNISRDNLEYIRNIRIDNLEYNDSLTKVLLYKLTETDSVIMSNQNKIVNIFKYKYKYK